MLTARNLFEILLAKFITSWNGHSLFPPQCEGEADPPLIHAPEIWRENEWRGGDYRLNRISLLQYCSKQFFFA